MVKFRREITGFLLGFYYKYYGNVNDFIDNLKNDLFRTTIVEIPAIIGVVRYGGTSKIWAWRIKMEAVLPDQNKIEQRVRELLNSSGQVIEEYKRILGGTINKIILEANKLFFDSVINEIAANPHLGLYEIRQKSIEKIRGILLVRNHEFQLTSNSFIIKFLGNIVLVNDVKGTI